MADVRTVSLDEITGIQALGYDFAAFLEGMLGRAAPDVQ
jgi:hypothetical protein